ISHLQYGQTVNVERQYNATLLGSSNVRVNCSNMISAMEVTTNVKMEEMVTGLEIVPSSFVVDRLDALTFNVSSATGSHMIMNVTYGDGISEIVNITNTKGGAQTSTIVHTFQTTGNFTTSVSGINTLSDVSYTLGKDIKVQNRVNGLEFKDIPSLLAIPPGYMEFEVVSTITDYPPTDVTCSLKIDEKQGPVKYAAVLSEG
ncbi:unnamed protein product, partial [Owenia fusiformis]